MRKRTIAATPAAPVHSTEGAAPSHGLTAGTPVMFTTPRRGGVTPERSGTYQNTTPHVAGTGGGSFHIIRDTATGMDVKVRPGSVKVAA